MKAAVENMTIIVLMMMTMTIVGFSSLSFYESESYYLKEIC